MQAGALDEKNQNAHRFQKGKAPAEVDLDYALGLLALPCEVGAHPETSDIIEASIGRFGPYLKYQGKSSHLFAER